MILGLTIVEFVESDVAYIISAICELVAEYFSRDF